VVELTHQVQILDLTQVLHLRLIILSVGGDVSVNSETLLMTDFVNLKIKSAQSFKGTHMSRVCIRVFIEVNVRTYISICICIVFLKFNHLKYLTSKFFKAGSTRLAPCSPWLYMSYQLIKFCFQHVQKLRRTRDIEGRTIVNAPAHHLAARLQRRLSKRNSNRFFLNFARATHAPCRNR
jgi:hypothetical protein